MRSNKKQTEPDLKKVTLEAIKSAKRLMALGEKGFLGVGAQRLVRRRLSQLERELRDRRRKPPTQMRLKAIVRETATLISELMKSLLRYLFLRPSGWNPAPWAS